MAEVKQACGNPYCGASTNIADQVAFGSGELDDYGFWENPCGICARRYEENHSGEVAWPFSAEQAALLAENPDIERQNKLWSMVQPLGDRQKADILMYLYGWCSRIPHFFDGIEHWLEVGDRVRKELEE